MRPSALIASTAAYCGMIDTNDLSKEPSQLREMITQATDESTFFNSVIHTQREKDTSLVDQDSYLWSLRRIPIQNNQLQEVLRSWNIVLASAEARCMLLQALNKFACVSHGPDSQNSADAVLGIGRLAAALSAETAPSSAILPGARALTVFVQQLNFDVSIFLEKAMVSSVSLLMWLLPHRQDLGGWTSDVVSLVRKDDYLKSLDAAVGIVSTALSVTLESNSRDTLIGNGRRIIRSAIVVFDRYRAQMTSSNPAIAVVMSKMLQMCQTDITVVSAFPQLNLLGIFDNVRI